MSYRNLLKTCRILVAVLVLNMVSPAVAQANDSSGYALICTSAGLTKVVVDDSDGFKSIAEASGFNSSGSSNKNSQTLDRSLEHCVYCNFSEKPVFYSNLAQSNLSSKSEKTVKFQIDTPPFLSKNLLRYVLLRAPPLYI